MKHYIYKAVVYCFAAFSLCACGDYLDEDPRDSLSDEEAYGTESALYRNAVLDIYNYIGGSTDSQGLQGTDRGVFDLNSISTDEAIIPTRGGDWYDGGLWQRLFTHRWSSADTPFYNTWNYLYKVVMLCNDYIEKVEQFAENNPGNSSVAAYKAELRAVRAVYYFYLMDLFGNVPLVTSTGISSDAIEQSSRSTVYRFVIDELTEAAPLLYAGRSNTSGDYYGRLTRPVAFAYLAKLTLNAEVYADDDWTNGMRTSGSDITFQVGSQELNAWQATIAYCDSVASYGYELAEEFSDNFSTTNNTSVENIFTIPMDPSLYPFWYNYFFRSRHYCHGSVLGGASENGTCATIELLDAMGYGSSAEDPRFTRTFYADNVVVDGAQVMMDDGQTPLVYYPREVQLDLTGTTHMATAGARWGKYEVDRHANADGRACHNDIVLLRYADILLMKAEAQVRNGQDGSEALNAVRARVGLSSVAATLDNILHERYVELAWEGWRRNDMIRFGIYHNAYTDRPTLDGEQNGYTTVFPIPLEVLSMHPQWTQNAGY